MSSTISDLNNVDKNTDESKTAPEHPKWQGLSVLIIGLGIGWLAGLSTSPVVAGIITSLLGLGAGVVTGLQTIRQKQVGNTKESYFDARPAALLVLGISLAASCGIIARTYHIFEPSRDPITYVKSQTASPEKNYSSTSQDRGVLYGKYEEECDQILGLATMGNYSAFVGVLKESSIPRAKEMVTKFQDNPETLEFFVKTVCVYYQMK